VLLTWAFEPAILAPLLPAGTVLDTFGGRTLASVVGFRFLRTRLLGLPVPGHRDFEEVNLRFYVRRKAAGEVRHGVAFVRELVPRAAVTAVARLVYNEPYRTVPMRSAGHPPGRLVYEWCTQGRWQHVAATAAGEPSVPGPDSEAAFITHHLWGYTRQRDGSTLEYEVEHPPWRVWEATAPALEADVAGLYGPAFTGPLSCPPVSVLVAEGSAVTVYRARRC
jgi:uncharacterized protein YqjF (DUF2071 family)